MNGCSYNGSDRYGCPNCLGECGVLKSKLQQFGAALYGPRYQRELAAALGVNERTMRRWVAGDYPPPEGVLADLRKLAADRVRELRALARLKK